MKLNKAKFNSTCAETGQRIPKGTNMMYDYSTRKCYSLDSQAASNQHEADGANGMVQAQEDAYFDRFSQRDNEYSAYYHR